MNFSCCCLRSIIIDTEPPVLSDVLLKSGLEWNMIKIEEEKDQSGKKKGIAEMGEKREE